MGSPVDGGAERNGELHCERADEHDHERDTRSEKNPQ
jgi:hypothetical protein